MFVENYIRSAGKDTLSVQEPIAWDARFEVTADGKGLVKNAGVVLLRKTADAVGLTARIATVFRPGRADRLCRGAVLVGAAAAIAAGARNLSQTERLLDHHAGTFGRCGSDSTLWRVLAQADEQTLRRLARAQAQARRTVWRLLGKRPGGFPWLTIAGKRLDKWIVVDLDATVIACHSGKEQATGTFKGTFGHHHLGGWIANTGETVSLLPRPGNSGSNTAADHVTVIDQVLAQVPDENKHAKILVRIDGAGASHDTIAYLQGLNHSRRRVAWTIGWTITEAEQAAIAAMPETAWSAYLDQDGNIRTIPDPDAAGVLDDHAPGGVCVPNELEYGHVVEITGLLHRPGWPDGTRWIARRVPITDRDRNSGKLTDLEKHTGWKYAVTATNIERMRGIPGTGHAQWLDAAHRHHAVVEDRVRTGKNTGLGLLPSKSWTVNCAWTFLAALARDLDCWTRLLGFQGHDLLCTAEPATMRELVYTLPARLARHAHRTWLRLDAGHPHTDAITLAWHRLSTLPAIT